MTVSPSTFIMPVENQVSEMNANILLYCAVAEAASRICSAPVDIQFKTPSVPRDAHQGSPWSF